VNKIVGTEHPLKKIFSKEFDFEIPSYQRPYSWTIEEAGILFDDLYDFMLTQKEDEAYFLGSIVLIKNETDPKAQVIDGQQRLTTLTILLAAIASKLGPDDAREFISYIKEPGKRAEGLEPKPRLALRDRDKEFFEKYVQNDLLDELINLDPGGFNDVYQNIHANTKLYVEQIAKVFGDDTEKLFQFGSFIVNRCYLVSVSTASMKSAYRIFSVLNNRGLDLLASDLLKAEIIGGVPDNGTLRDNYNEKWEDLEEDLGRNTFNDLFSHLRMIYARVKLRKTILDELQEILFTPEFDSATFIDDILEPYAEAFDIIIHADYESASDASKLNDTLKWLNRIDNFDWIPPAILFLSKNKGNLDKLTTFFILLERFAASMFLRRLTVNDRIANYSILLEEISSGHDFDLDHGSLGLDEDAVRGTIGMISGDVYKMSKRPRTYLLLRLDSWISDHAAEYDHKILTVEHVLPQTVDPESEWSKVWPDEEVRESWVHKLGNLLLLSRRKNSQAQNYDFLVKKDKYFKGRGGVSTFAITTTVLDQVEWTQEFVENRQRELVETAKSHWDLSR
jgi:uncharacterized protein with ParB-like and HNH nuclease domain